MTYDATETIVLKSEVTRDQAESLDNMSATISIVSDRGVLVSKAPMIVDLDASTSEKKIFTYPYTIPANVRGEVQWWVTVTGASGYNTIAKSTFTVE